MIANFFAVIGIFLMGPSKILSLPNLYQLMLIGLSLTGLGVIPPHSLAMA